MGTISSRLRAPLERALHTAPRHHSTNSLGGRNMRTMRQVALSCESLESRECPAVQAFLVGGTLTVVGDSLANTITVTDNGTTVSVLDNGTPLGNSPFSGVTSVVVRGGGGDDTIDYTTD